MFKKSLVVTGLLVLSGSVFAAIPAEVSTAMSTAAADVTTIGGLALVAVVAAAAFKYARRAL